MVQPWTSTQYSGYPYGYSRISGNYAFLNHSSATLPNNLPPNVDDKPLARQKRRRTSPEDQAVLEAAYDRDPKPEKVARLELVKLVSLGEKEVQIWFQNRRQSSRRKSRPLLPHEIAQYQLSRSGISQSMPPKPEYITLGEDEEDEDASQNEDVDQSDIQLQSQADSSELPIAISESDTDPQTTPATSQTSRPASPHFVPAQDVLAGQDARSSVHMGSNLSAAPFCNLASRRSEPSLRLAQAESRPDPAFRLASIDNSCRSLKKAASFVRISMTCEGNAKIITKDTSSPSPPRPLPTAQLMGGSAALPSLADRLGPTTTLQPPTKSLQRSTSGRSRDSRAWEFWCDKDARGELEDKAEKDASGSAADAIGLLRSTSGRNILGSIPLKRNSLVRGPASSSKRSKLDRAGPTLQKSSTSMGRLQGTNPSSTNLLRKPALLTKFSDSTGSVYIPGNESDKENLSPDSGVHSSENLELRRWTSAHTQSSSAKSLERLSHTNGRQFTKADGSVRDDENCDPEADLELATFMGARRNESSNPAEDRDLDCIQGLLSLSQGNWR